MRCANVRLKRQKSISSQPSRSPPGATVFDCPSIVAALTTSRCVVASISAARRKIAARCSQGIAPTAGRGFLRRRSRPRLLVAPAWWNVARRARWSCGIAHFSTLRLRALPPITSGISISVGAHAARAPSLSEAFSALPVP
jgi:hypothetical protein